MQDSRNFVTVNASTGAVHPYYCALSSHSTTPKHPEKVTPKSTESSFEKATQKVHTQNIVHKDDEHRSAVEVSQVELAGKKKYGKDFRIQWVQISRGSKIPTWSTKSAKLRMKEGDRLSILDTPTEKDQMRAHWRDIIDKEPLFRRVYEKDGNNNKPMIYSNNSRFQATRWKVEGVEISVELNETNFGRENSIQAEPRENNEIQNAIETAWKERALDEPEGEQIQRNFFEFDKGQKSAELKCKIATKGHVVRDLEFDEFKGYTEYKAHCYKLWSNKKSKIDFEHEPTRKAIRKIRLDSSKAHDMQSETFMTSMARAELKKLKNRKRTPMTPVAQKTTDTTVEWDGDDITIG